MADTTEVRDNPNTAFEHSDWRIGVIGWVALGTFIFLVIALVVLMWAYSVALSDVDRHLTVAPPPPRLQTNPAQDLANFETAETRKLDSYYWVDRQNGIVHIPIEGAMKKVAADGIDGFPHEVAVKRAALAALVAFGVLGSIMPARGGADLGSLAFDPHPGALLPLTAPLVDENGRAAPLARFFTGAPVILVLDYLRCRTFCGLTLKDVIAARGALPKPPALLTVSIDPRDTPADAAAARIRYLAGPRADDSGVHFLTGPESSVRQIAAAIGFRYRYDPDLDQFAHPAGFIVASPQGGISRYFFGVEADPAQLANALSAATEGRTSNPLIRFLLICHLDPTPPGRFTLAVEGAFALANLAGMAGLVAVFAAIRRRRHG